MENNDVRTNNIIIVWGFSVLIALVFLNRWIVTPEGIYSFGRVWQYFVSYTDFGFARRELFGTLLSVTRLNQLGNAYEFSYVIYGIEILIFSSIILKYCLKYNPFPTLVAYFALFFSPAFILQSAYLTGTQDLEVLILATIISLYVNNFAIFIVLCVVGVLVHSLFVFLLPFLFAYNFWKTNHTKSDLYRHALAAILMLAVIVLTVIGGQLDVPKDVYQNAMAAKMPAAVDHHPLWSGYYEVSSSVDQNEKTHMFKEVVNHWWYAFIPLTYAILLAFVVAAFARLKVYKRIILFFSLLFPLLTIFVATDVYRWIGMSADLSLIALLALNKERIIQVPRFFYYLMAAFFIVAPFGAAQLSRPFPALQFVLGHILRRH